MSLNNEKLWDVLKQVQLYFLMTWDVISTKYKDTVHIYKKAGIFHEPTTPPSVFSYVNNVKILSFNIDDIAYHRHYYTNKDEARAVEIINYIDSTHSDVICLQEVWSETMKQELMDAFIAKNYYVALPPWDKKFFVGENSGLMLISKYPIISQTFLKFGNNTFGCSFTNKGVQYCHVRIPSEDPETSTDLYLANAHLQASFTYISSFLDFSKRAETQLDSIIKNCPYESSLLVGDMNMNKKQMDAFIENRRDVYYFGEHQGHTFVVDNSRLDYFLKIVKNKKNVHYNMLNNTKNSVENNIALSDHYPILSEFELKNVDNSDLQSPTRASP